MDTELFELCKAVYERLPEWDDTENELSPKGHLWPRGGFKDFHRGSSEEATPLYNSDYLLEKLPKALSEVEDIPGVYWNGVAKLWCADYGNERYHAEYSDAPLKALLKLVLALDYAGELTSSEAKS